MVGITRNQQMSYFQSDTMVEMQKKKKKKEVSKNFKDSKTTCKQE